MNGQELRALFFERLEHRDADAEYELRHPDDVLETPQFAVSSFPNRSHSVVKVVNQGSMSVSRAVPEEGWMKLTNRDVLISGASVAGPTLAWWLCRAGFTPRWSSRPRRSARAWAGMRWTCWDARSTWPSGWASCPRC
jgi:hypothetical protein